MAQNTYGVKSIFDPYAPQSRLADRSIGERSDVRLSALGSGLWAPHEFMSLEGIPAYASSPSEA